MIFRNTGQKYEGYWMNGMQHGNGKMINPQGQTKSGKWEKGKNVQWFDQEPTGGKIKKVKLRFIVDFLIGCLSKIR